MRATRAAACRAPPAVAKRVLFFGGDRVSVVALRGLADRAAKQGGHIEVVAPPAHVGPANPVYDFCAERGIKVHYVTDPRKITRQSLPLDDPGGLGSASFDASVVVSFRYFLPNWLLDAVPPAVNMHPSLLPKYRGASPLVEAMKRNDSESGVSIVKVLPQELMDCGDILAQRAVAVPPAMDMREYFPMMTALGRDVLLETLDDLGARWAAAAPQPNKVPFREDPFHAPLHTRNSSRLNVLDMTGEQAFGLWRAFVDSHPPFALFDKLATPIGKHIKSEAKRAPVRIVINEALPRAAVPHVFAELDEAEARENAGGSLFGPGTVYVPKCAPHTVAIHCEWGWLLAARVTLHGGHHQEAGELAAGCELRPGKVWPGVILTPPFRLPGDGGNDA